MTITDIRPTTPDLHEFTAAGWDHHEATILANEGYTARDATGWLGTGHDIADVLFCLRAGVTPFSDTSSARGRARRWCEDDWA